MNQTSAAISVSRKINQIKLQKEKENQENNEFYKILEVKRSIFKGYQVELAGKVTWL